MLQTIKTPKQVKMIQCSKCSGEMPELRKTMYGYTFCVNCSDNLNLVGKKRALTTQMGEGDHTWNETIIMEEKDFLEYERILELNSGINIKSNNISFEDDDERNLQGPFRIINNGTEEE